MFCERYEDRSVTYSMQLITNSIIRFQNFHFASQSGIFTPGCLSHRALGRGISLGGQQHTHDGFAVLLIGEVQSRESAQRLSLHTSQTCMSVRPRTQSQEWQIFAAAWESKQALTLGFALFSISACTISSDLFQHYLHSSTMIALLTDLLTHTLSNQATTPCAWHPCSVCLTAQCSGEAPLCLSYSLGENFLCPINRFSFSASMFLQASSTSMPSSKNASSPDLGFCDASGVRI